MCCHIKVKIIAGKSLKDAAPLDRISYVYTYTSLPTFCGQWGSTQHDGCVYSLSHWLKSVSNKFPSVTLTFKLNSAVSFIQVTSIPLAQISCPLGFDFSRSIPSRLSEFSKLDSPSRTELGNLQTLIAAAIFLQTALLHHLKHVRANNMHNRRGAKTICIIIYIYIYHSHYVIQWYQYISFMLFFENCESRITGNPRQNANNPMTRKTACLRAGQSRPWVAKPLSVEPGQMQCWRHQSSNAGAAKQRRLDLKSSLLVCSSPCLNSLKHWVWGTRIYHLTFSQKSDATSSWKLLQTSLFQAIFFRTRLTSAIVGNRLCCPAFGQPPRSKHTPRVPWVKVEPQELSTRDNHSLRKKSTVSSTLVKHCESNFELLKSHDSQMLLPLCQQLT